MWSWHVCPIPATPNHTLSTYRHGLNYLNSRDRASWSCDPHKAIRALPWNCIYRHWETQAPFPLGSLSWDDRSFKWGIIWHYVFCPHAATWRKLICNKRNGAIIPGDAEVEDGREKENESMWTIVWGLDSPELIGIRVEFLSHLTEKTFTDILPLSDFFFYVV